MGIHELTQVVPPPQNPLEVGDPATWQAVQVKLRISLPLDFREFGSVYGSGRFEVSPAIRIYNPFSPKYVEEVTRLCEALRLLRKEEGRKQYPFKFFPQKTGLLPCGSDDIGTIIHWLTEKEPEKWEIVLQSRDCDYERFPGPLTSFLAKAIKKDIRPAIWGSAFNMDPKDYRFISQATPEEKTYSTIYELYEENGNRARFWARRMDEPPSSLYYIKTIDARESGPLSNQLKPVLSDYYFHGELLQKDLQMVSPEWKKYVTVEAPEIKGDQAERAES